MRIIDGDGHIDENIPELVEFLPSDFFYRHEDNHKEIPNIFPPSDHFHNLPLVAIRGAERGTVGPGEWTAFLNSTGIEMTTLYPTKALSYGKIMNPDLAIYACRAYNDWLHDRYMKADERFKGMALIPLQDVDAAIEELRRAVQILGMQGAVLPSNSRPNQLGAKLFWPIYAEAERLGCALALHGGCHDRLGFDDTNVVAVANALGHPVGQMSAMCSIIVNGVFDRFPGLRIAFLEGGVGWFVTVMERLDRGWKTHVQADPRGELFALRKNESVMAYIIRQVQEGRLFVGCEGDEEILPAALNLFGCNPFLYSSDFPHEVTTESCKEEIEEIAGNSLVSEENRTAILSKNAEKLYRLLV
jgi:uncharacterized protein